MIIAPDLEARLDLLLWQNYGQDEIDPHCAHLLVDYLTRMDSLSHQSMYFIKHLTKVANKLMKGGGIDHLLEKLYRFTMEGVSKVRQSDGALPQLQLAVMESHLLSYAADVARQLAAKGNSVEWQERSYEANLQAATIIEYWRKDEAAYNFGFAGDAAAALFHSTQDLYWGLEWHTLKVKAADMLSKCNLPQQAGRSYFYAGKAAEKLYQATGETVWIDRWLKGAVQSSERLREDPHFRGLSCSLVSEAAGSLFDLTKNPLWQKIALRYYHQCILAQ